MEWHYLEDALLAIKIEESPYGGPQFFVYAIHLWDYIGDNGHTLDSYCLFSGRVKQDGCSDWNFDKGSAIVHYCSKGQMRQISTGLEWCYEYARAHIEYFDGDD